jgi:SAM-dependent methyltransferase
MLGVLHHLADPEQFIREADRVLVPGGRMVLVEPNNSFPQKILCKLLDHYEYFDLNVPDWKNHQSNVMTSANLAVPWLMFHRDRALFEARFPNLEIVKIGYHSLFLRLLSGGMTYKSFVPEFTMPVFQGVERVLRPLMKYLGIAMTVDVRKRIK